MSDMVPRKDITAQAVKGAGGVGGAIALAVLNAIAAPGLLSIPGLIVGGLILLVGSGFLKSEKEKTAGVVLAAVGIATLVCSFPIIGGIGSFILGGAALVSAVFGGWNLFKFFKNMSNKKNRGY